MRLRRLGEGRGTHRAAPPLQGLLVVQDNRVVALGQDEARLVAGLSQRLGPGKQGLRPYLTLRLEKLLVVQNDELGFLRFSVVNRAGPLKRLLDGRRRARVGPLALLLRGQVRNEALVTEPRGRSARARWRRRPRPSAAAAGRCWGRRGRAPGPRRRRSPAPGEFWKEPAE